MLVPEQSMFKSYTNAIESSLIKQRATYMGQMKPIQALIPMTDNISTSLLAELVAEFLTIQICRVVEPDDNSLMLYKNWLASVIGHVVGYCPKEDHTLFSLVKLARQKGYIVSDIIFEDIPQALRDTLLHPPEDLPDTLEKTFWLLMEDQEKIEYLNCIR